MEKSEIGEKAAEEIVRRTDKARVGYIKAIFGKDWFDLKNYDMVFNAATQSYDQISKIIVDALRAKDQMITPDTWDLLVAGPLPPASGPASSRTPKFMHRR